MMNAKPARLLERDRELDVLAALADAAGAGGGRVALIEGPPGIGKSALLAAATGLARERHMVPLVARGGELERDFAFGVVRQLFEPALASLDPSETGTLFSGAAGLAGPLLRAGATPAADTPAGDVFPLLHGLYWLIAGLAATRPCLIAVDDAQWADAPSLRWLDYLVRRLEDLPVLVVVGARSTAPEVPTPLLDTLRAEPGVVFIRPKPLSEDATAEVLGDVFGRQPDTELARASHEASGGNPFLLTELARALAADGRAPDAATGAAVRHMRPEAIARGVLVRLGHLSPPAQAMARAMAVLDSDTDLRLAAALARQGDTEAGEAADRLAGAGFLAASRPLRFTHPLIRSVIYGDLPASERARAHRRAAAILAEASAPLERVVAHLVATEPGADPWVVEQLRTAAAAASAQGALEAAIDYLRRALSEPAPESQRPAILLELGRAESGAAHPDAARHLVEAFHLAGDAAGRADAAEAATSVLLSSGRTRETIELLELVAGELGSRDPDRAVEFEAMLVAAGMLDPSAVGIAVDRLERIGEGLQGRTRGERSMLCFLAYHRTWRSQDAAGAADLARRAVAGGRLIADGAAPHELNGPIWTFICADEVDAVSALLDDALADARARGSEIDFSFVSCMRAAVALRRGGLGEVEADAGTALEITMRSGLFLGSAVNASLLVSALIERGAVDRAQEVLRSLGMQEGAIPPPMPFNLLLGARGRLRLAQGDLRLGIEDLAECGRRNDVFGIRNPVFVPWRVDLALAERASGNLQRARALADEELTAAQSWGTPGSLGRAEHLLALVTPDAGSAIDGLHRAVELLERSPAQLDHARALTDLGAALRRANARTEARGPLQDGLHLAEHCGATILAERARRELLATGARPRRQVLRGVDSLTASERRVADLAVRGLSNPEIAQALFVGRKTVETHLGHVYDKLAIRSRDELPTLLGSSA